MADGYDSLFESYLKHLPAKPLQSQFYCRYGGELYARPALHGGVVHVCGRCDHEIHQTWAQFRQQRAAIATDCPMITMSRQRRR